MRYKLVIAEKPSVAQSLAAVIGATARKDGYLEGNGWRVSWCVGHLAGLADADSYDPKGGKLYLLWERRFTFIKVFLYPLLFFIQKKLPAAVKIYFIHLLPPLLWNYVSL